MTRFPAPSSLNFELIPLLELIPVEAIQAIMIAQRTDLVEPLKRILFFNSEYKG